MMIDSSKINFKIRTVCEVGTGGDTAVHQSRNLHEISDNLILVEPNPKSFATLNFNFGNNPKFKLYEAAISSRSGVGKYYNWLHDSENASGFIEGQESPMMVNHGYVPNDTKDSIEVKFLKFSEIDDGKIDILFVDTEGSEWFVLRDMISKPKIIAIETHGGMKYLNPNLNLIQAWMTTNGYVPVAKDESDTLYINQDLIKLHSSINN